MVSQLLLWKIEHQWPYSQNLITFLWLKNWPNKPVLHITKAERLVGEKHSSLMSLFLSSEENEDLFLSKKITQILQREN